MVELKKTVSGKTEGVICIALYSFDIGGSERLSVSLARRYKELGYEVICLATRRGIGPLCDVLEEYSIRWSALDLDHQSRLSKVYQKRGLATWFSAHNVDALHVQHLCVLHDVLNASRRAGVKSLVVTEHTPEVLRDRVLYRRLLRKLRSGAEQLTAINSSVRQALREIDGRRDIEIPIVTNGIDIERFAPGTAGKGKRALDIAWLGRMHPDKDIATGLKAFSYAARKSRSPLQLKIAGDGPELSFAKNLARKIGISEQIEFLGAINDVASFLRDCDVFLMSSITEGTPLALLEAMASGLPIVATQVGGVAAAVTSECAILSRPNDFVALGEALLKITKDQPLRVSMAAAARHHAVKKYSDVEMAKRYLELLFGQADAT